MAHLAFDAGKIKVEIALLDLYVGSLKKLNAFFEELLISISIMISHYLITCISYIYKMDKN